MRDKILEILRKDIDIELKADELSALLGPKPKSEVIKWDDLLKFFNDKTGMQKKVVSTKVKSKIQARLREGYTKTDIMNTIINIVNNDFHKETNYQHVTLEFISRSDTIDKYAYVKKVDKPRLGLNTR